MTQRLTAKTALITGADQGIGAAIARSLVQEGGFVYLTDINDALGAKRAEERGDQARYLRLDVRSEVDWQRVTAQVLAERGRLDVLVNNAGITGLSISLRVRAWWAFPVPRPMRPPRPRCATTPRPQRVQYRRRSARGRGGDSGGGAGARALSSVGETRQHGLHLAALARSIVQINGIRGFSMRIHLSTSSLVRPLAASLALAATLATAQTPPPSAPHAAVLALAQQEQPLLLDTLRDLVNIESGSKDLEGLDKIAALIASQLRQRGGTVEILRPTDVYRLDDTPEQLGPVVHATFQGQGTKKIMFIAHMDTVYLKGMLKDQPFRIDGDKAYGLGIGDDKQGVATIIHTVGMLRKLGFKDYGTLTVLINGDEEISSPGARATITRLAAQQDAVFSFEGGGATGSLRLATSGIGAAYLTVDGKASHAGASPEKGVNALYELSHQLLQMKELSRPEQGLKLNWTVASAGTNRNVIPAQARAQADARALKVSDFDALEKQLQAKVHNKLLPDSKVQVKFEVRRPPLEATAVSRRVAAHGKAIYEEIGLPLAVLEEATGGGTDAAFAGLQTQGAVVEGMGLSSFGAHSNDAEYVLVNTIVPRLYLATRMVMDLSSGALQ